jgi:uncharacterized protein (DUF983 family)
MTTTETPLRRILGLRCPHCGGDRAYESWMRMRRRCRACGLLYEREAGYFLGSTYLNYGLTVLLCGVAALVLGAGFDHGLGVLIPVWIAICALFPLWFFRYARLWWLAFDLKNDAPTARDFAPDDAAERRLE